MKREDVSLTKGRGRIPDKKANPRAQMEAMKEEDIHTWKEARAPSSSELKMILAKTSIVY